MNPNWTRWIYASITEHFNNLLAENGINIWVEGQARQANTHYQYEIRMDGPYFAEQSKGQFVVRLAVSITVQTLQNPEDFHLHLRNIGKVQAAFKELMLYKYGDGPDDDSTTFGCLQLDPAHPGVRTQNYGQVSPADAIEQAYVEARFKTNLEVRS